MKTDYTPSPIDTTNVEISEQMKALSELLSKNTHEVWSKERMARGWTWGPERDDANKKHPDLIPYEELTDDEKQYDRNTSMETIKVILSLGYKIM